jgi:hypothetical protein
MDDEHCGPWPGSFWGVHGPVQRRAIVGGGEEFGRFFDNRLGRLASGGEDEKRSGGGKKSLREAGE